MARRGLHMLVTQSGFKEFSAFLASICTAASNAHLDDIGLASIDGEVSANGVKLVELRSRHEPGGVVITVKPTPGMILFIGWLMTKLPSTASVVWRDGWPHVTCPPYDDREPEEGPAPLVPGQCVPA